MFESVIGLEIHAQLATGAKLFCRCPVDVRAEPNDNLCPVCGGHPGALPVLNSEALDMAVLAGLALGCRINRRSVFARKNYFYPDLPKGYQISQMDEPLCSDGTIEIEASTGSRKVRIQRVHMEEDAGKSVHQSGSTLVNLNRACTPLIEIVSHPDLRTPEECAAYMRKVRLILMYVGVNDGNLQEGNLRCDANVSVRPAGSTTLGTRAEIKNVNSFRFLEKAVEYEINRQVELVKTGGKVVLETRGYDSGKNTTHSLRSKEEAHDYRYFPEPDLTTVVVEEAHVATVRAKLVELPDAKKARYVSQWGIPAADAAVLTSSRALADYFEVAADASGEPRAAAHWVMGELLRLMKSDDTESDVGSHLSAVKARPQALGALIGLVKAGVISNTAAKAVFEEMFATGRDPDAIVQEKGMAQVSDTGAIEKALDEMLAANAAQVAEYRAGKDKVFGFLVGQAMRAMKGKGNPAVINDLLKKKLQS